MLNIEDIKLKDILKNEFIELINSAVIAIDREANIVIFNNRAQSLVGVSKSEALGKKINEIVPNSILPQIVESGDIHINEVIEVNNKKVIGNKKPIIVDNEIIGAIALLQDVSEQDNLLKELNFHKKSSQTLSTIIETLYDGILVVDKEGFITMISKAYAQFLKVDDKKVIGMHVTKVIENTRMHIVAKTGVAEVSDVQKINGGQMIASRLPIVKDGQVVGAVGKVLFRNLGELDSLNKKLNAMEKKIEQYKVELKQLNQAKYSFDNIIGYNNKIIETKKYARKAAFNDSNVLVTGESGTGKELFAHAIHSESKRKYGPFIKVNCAAIPSELLESELFGYEEGAFTGAKKGGKLGKFELADGGTIFLDEIGDMPLYMQAKLLRVIQEREVERVGGSTQRIVNVRIIAATNCNLEEMVNEGKFRKDLFYRLNVITISIPALRERVDDIPKLSYHLLGNLNLKFNKFIDKISEDALKYLCDYDWPGNVRELANVIERAINVIDEEFEIKPIHLPSRIAGSGHLCEVKNLQLVLEEAERKAISDALRATGGNRTKAAKLLNISRTSFYEKMLKLDLLNKE